MKLLDFRIGKKQARKNSPPVIRGTVKGVRVEIYWGDLPITQRVKRILLLRPIKDWQHQKYKALRLPAVREELNSNLKKKGATRELINREHLAEAVYRVLDQIHHDLRAERENRRKRSINLAYDRAYAYARKIEPLSL